MGLFSIMILKTQSGIGEGLQGFFSVFLLKEDS